MTHQKVADCEAPTVLIRRRKLCFKKEEVLFVLVCVSRFERDLPIVDCFNKPHSGSYRYGFQIKKTPNFISKGGRVCTPHAQIKSMMPPFINFSTFFAIINLLNNFENNFFFG